MLVFSAIYTTFSGKFSLLKRNRSLSILAEGAVLLVYGCKEKTLLVSFSLILLYFLIIFLPFLITIPL